MTDIWITKSAKDSKRIIKLPKGTVAPPIPYIDLIDAYEANPYHASAIDVKTINILGNGIKEDAVNKKLSELSSEQSLHSLLENTIRDLLLIGNAFWELPKDQIFHLPAHTMYRSDKGWTQVVDSQRVDYDLSEIWHFRMNSLRSSFYGGISYTSILPAIQLISTIQSFNKSFFKNNAIPDLAIITEGGVLSPAAEYNIKRFLSESLRGEENAHKTLYIPLAEGIKLNFVKLQSERDMQFSELYESCISEIIACHGVPPRLLGIHVPGKLGGAAETVGEMQIFYRTRIAPLQNIIGGYLDTFFKTHLGISTDITFDSFDYSDDSTAQALSLLRG